jgi:hypothetical protein
MNSGITVFKQLLQFLPRYEFNLCVRRYRGEYQARRFSTFDQFLCLAYVAVTDAETEYRRLGFRNAMKKPLSMMEIRNKLISKV